MSTTNRGRKRRAPTESSKHSDTNDNLSADDGISVPGTATFDETFSQISGARRRRKKYSSPRRNEVAQVRKVGACTDCRARKVRCVHALTGAAPAPKPSPQPFPFDFEKSYPEIEYPENDWENDPERWPRREEAEDHDQSFNDGDDLIATVPASTKRQERLALDLDDIDNIIGDNSRSSVARTRPSTPEWGRNSQWMTDATTLTNNQNYSQPSTTAYSFSFSTQNFSVNTGPLSSTPASSNADLLPSNIQDVGHNRCQVASCDDSRVFTQEIHLRHHQETKHAELFQPEITFTCPVSGCRTGRYGKRERLKMHIICTHPETLESPTQLPTSELLERDPQFDRRAQVSEFIAGQYLAGMEENTIPIPDRKASGELHPASSDSWLRARSSRRAWHQRTHVKPYMRRSSTPIQRQHSPRINDDSIHAPPGQFSMANTDHRIIIATNSMSPLSQRRSLQVQNTVERISEFDVPYGISQGYPLRTNSPTPSFIGQFENNMHLSDQAYLLKPSSEVGEDIIGASIPRGPHGMYATTTASTASARNWNSDNQPMTPIIRETFDRYQNNLRHSQPEAGSQSGYHDTSLNVSGWLGNDLSASAGQIDVFATDYSSLQSNIPRYLANDETSLKFPLQSNSSRQPVILLNDDALLHTNQDNPFAYASNALNLDPSLSQQPSLPRLVHSNMSSSGASESLVSPVDAPNLYSSNFEAEDWEMASNFFNDLSNMDVNMNNEPM